MSTLTYKTVIGQLFNQLDTLLQNYVFSGYDALANALKYPLGLAATLYIVLLGISIAQGWTQLAMGNFVKTAIKIALIYSLAMNWSFFSAYAVKLIQDGASEIGTVLIKATPMPLPHAGGEGIEGALQSVLSEFTEIGSWVWNKGSLYNPAPFFSAFVFWLLGDTLILVAMFELVLAKVMLAILLATAPLFICFTLFRPTYGLFDRWLGVIVGFALMIVLVSAALAFCLSIAQWSIVNIYSDHAMTVVLMSFVPAMLAAFLGSGIIVYVAKLAQTIGSGITTASESAALAPMIGSSLGNVMPISHTKNHPKEDTGKKNAPAIKATQNRLRSGDKP